MSEVNGTIFCDRCGFRISGIPGEDSVVVTESGQILCFNNYCAYSPEEEVVFTGSLVEYLRGQ